MNKDSEEQILKDWNARKLEKEFPWKPLQFNSLRELFDFVKKQAKEQGQQKRKTRLDRTKSVNILHPKTSLGKKAIENRKREVENLTTISLEFLKRIKAFKKIDKNNLNRI